MNKELKKEIKRQKDLQKGWEKKFDEEFGVFDMSDWVDTCFANSKDIKSFIDTHFIAKEEGVKKVMDRADEICRRADEIKYHLYTKADLLDILDKLPYGNEWSEAERYGAIQRVKEEIRERING